MIFTDRKITIRNGKSSINEPVILYRGDFEVSIKFTIMESKFRFKSGVNLVDSEKASFGQLAILAPYGGNVFSEIVKCEDGTVTFTLTKEMIDQLEEVGLYSFQIRLFDYYRESRVSIPPVEFGIEVREPVASEDHDNEVNNAIVGYSIAKVVGGLNEDVGDTFDDDGNYNKTEWKTGDRISQGKLNKIEDALDKINQNEKNDVVALDKRITNNYNVLHANKAEQSDLSLLKSRVDNIGVLSNGSTTGDAELIDGRVGYDGVISKSIGEAIRTQINDIHNIVGETQKEYLYDKGIDNVGFAKAHSNGIDGAGEPIIINNGEYYRISYTRTTNNGLATELSICTNSKIDLTNVDYIYIDWQQSVSGSSRAHLTVSPYKTIGRVGSGHIKNMQLNGKFDRKISRIDVRNVTGSYYVCVYSGNSSSSISTTSDVSVFSLYFTSSIFNNTINVINAAVDEHTADITELTDDIAEVENNLNAFKAYQHELLDDLNDFIYDEGELVKILDIGYCLATNPRILENTEEYYKVSYIPSGENVPQSAAEIKLDLTDIVSVVIDWEQVNDHNNLRANFTINPEAQAPRLSTRNVVSIEKFGKFDRTTTSIDTTDLEGNYYLGVHAAANSSNSAIPSAEVRIYKLYVIRKLAGIHDDIYDKLDAVSESAIPYDVYNEGVVNTGVTGELIEGFKQGISNSLLFSEDYIELAYQGTTTTSETGVVTTNKVNFANIRKIEVDWEYVSANGAKRANVCLHSNRNASRIDGERIKMTTLFARQKDVYDTTDITGSYYIGVHFGANAFNSDGVGRLYGIKLYYDSKIIIEGVEEENLPFPAYWNDEVNDSISKIQALQAAGGNSTTSVGFITDVHAGSREIYSAKMLEKIMNDCEIPYYFDGGDVVRGAGLEKKANLIYYIDKERNAFANLHDRCMRVIGNHDPAYSELGGTSYYEQNLTIEETYHEFFRPSARGTDLVWGDEGRYFYVDDQAHRIRYIGLDSTDTPYNVNKMRLFCFRQTQINWLANVALDVPDSTWSVVVCSHYAPTTYDKNHSIVNSHIILDILKAFKNNTSYSVSGGNASYPVSVNVDYTNKGGDVVCWMYGHVHADNIHVANEITVVSTEADVVDAEDNVTTGTIQEHAFDVFTINKATRTVNITRTGLGEDRSFTY